VDHYVRLRGGGGDDVRGGEVAVDELGGGVLCGDRDAAVRVADEKRVGPVWVGVVEGVEDVAADVAGYAGSADDVSGGLAIGRDVAYRKILGAMIIGEVGYFLMWECLVSRVS
jgi:hypothetical protein